jgi:NAD(P)-dependent dehydrogenase (short-subunit alcohol dehydrogenase family)
MHAKTTASHPGVALLSGCSSGFGLLAAIELAGAGFRVFASMRSLQKRGRLDAAARSAGVDVEVVALDVTRSDSIDRAVSDVVARAGAIDVLVNNAGYGIGGFVEELSMEELREQFETNFFGLVALTKAVLPGMRERRSGRVINVSSIGGRVAVPGPSAYCASKFAVEGFSESLRYEAMGDGIFVSLIEPGSFKTDIFDANRRMARRMLEPDAPHGAASKRMERQLARMLAQNHRDPADVARLIRRVATARRPRLRYLVGSDAWGEAVAKAVLPERALEVAVLTVSRLGSRS